MIDSQGRIRIIDFGIARVFDPQGKMTTGWPTVALPAAAHLNLRDDVRDQPGHHVQ